MTPAWLYRNRGQLKPADYAWLGLGVGVLVWEVAADDLLSDAADRAMEAHPWLTRVAVAAVALHLINTLPAWGDPLHWLLEVNRMRRADTSPSPR